MAIGHPVISFDTVESTNKTAAELLRLSKVQHGAVIVARAQTAGEGQRGRTWVSEPGADLTLSVVLEPERLRAVDQFELSKVAALAVAEVVRQRVSGEVRIKWPNDVLVGRNKVSGILIKNELVGEWVQSSVVGIGINVNSAGFPDELVATSLLLETGGVVPVDGLRQDLCAALARYWALLERGGADLAEAYTAQLWMRGRWAEMVLDARPVTVRPLDVDGSGRLLVEDPDGRVAVYGLDRLRFAPR